MHVLRGKIYMKEGDYEHAIQSFQDAMVPTLVHASLELQMISVVSLLTNCHCDTYLLFEEDFWLES